MDKLVIERAIVVEGRDDVDAVGKAVSALIIPTHGFGIRKETWKLIEKADREKGIIILTDPDYSGEEIRRRLSAKFPDAMHAYIAQEDALSSGDIGVENATPEIIAEAINKALEMTNRLESATEGEDDNFLPVEIGDLYALGLCGAEGSNELRARLCAELGIGYGNASALIKKLKLWRIGYKELEQAIEKIKK